MSRLFVLSLFLVCVGCSSEPPKPYESKAPTAKFATDAPAPGTPPETLFFESAYGDVTYNHRLHAERVSNNCATCHPSVFPQELKALDYGRARHRAAEEAKTSCATCHGISGSAFAAERNCQKCHDLKSKH